MKVIGKPIQMIADFKEDGSIKPIRFKLEEDGAKVIKRNDKSNTIYEGFKLFYIF